MRDGWQQVIQWAALSVLLFCGLLVCIRFWQMETATPFVATAPRSSLPSVVTVVVQFPTVTPTPTRGPYPTPRPTRTPQPTWGPDATPGHIYIVPKLTTPVVPMTVIVPTYQACPDITPRAYADQLCIQPSLELPEVWK